VKHLRRCDVDLVKRLVHVRRSKNETSHRVIPLNASAIEAAARMFERADLLGHTEPELNRTGFIGGLFPREDGAHGTTQ
jgi:integrase